MSRHIGPLVGHRTVVARARVGAGETIRLKGFLQGDGSPLMAVKL